MGNIVSNMNQPHKTSPEDGRRKQKVRQEEEKNVFLEIVVNKRINVRICTQTQMEEQETMTKQEEKDAFLEMVVNRRANVRIHTQAQMKEQGTRGRRLRLSKRSSKKLPLCSVI